MSQPIKYSNQSSPQKDLISLQSNQNIDPTSIHTTAMSTGIANNNQQQQYNLKSQQGQNLKNLEAVQEYSIESENAFQQQIQQQGQQTFQQQYTQDTIKDLLNKPLQQSQQGNFKTLNGIQQNPASQQQQNYFQQLYQEEKQKNMVIQEKLGQKDKLISQMKSFHNELCTAYEDAQEELQKIKKDRGVLTEKEEENKKLQQQFKDIEQIQLSIESENKQLTKKNMEKETIISQLEVQNDILQKDNSVLNQKLQLQLEKYIQLEKDFTKLQNLDRDNFSNLQDFKFKVDQLTEDNARMSLKIDNNENDTRILLQEREELLNRIAKYEYSLRSIEKAQEIKIEEVLLEAKKIHEEEQNQALIQQQYKYHQKEKKLKEQILQQKQQIKYMDQELSYFHNNDSSKKPSQYQSQIHFQSQKQPSGTKNPYQSDIQQQQQQQKNDQHNIELDKQLKVSQIRIQNLENALSQFISPSKQQSESLDSDNFVHKLLSDFQSQDLSDLYHRIKEQKKLAECLQNMVMNFHPNPNSQTLQQQQQSQELPPLKTAWKWLKKILEDYMVVKKSQRKLMERDEQSSGLNLENQHIVDKVQDFLKVDSKKEIIGKIADLLIEGQIAYRMFQKVKKTLGCEWVQKMSDLENILTENQIQQRNKQHQQQQQQLNQMQHSQQSQDNMINSPKFNDLIQDDENEEEEDEGQQQQHQEFLKQQQYMQQQQQGNLDQELNVENDNENGDIGIDNENQRNENNNRKNSTAHFKSNEEELLQQQLQQHYQQNEEEEEDHDEEEEEEEEEEEQDE